MTTWEQSVTVNLMNSTTVWRAGSLVRIREGRGTVFSFSPLGGYAVVKLIATGRKVTVRVTEMQSGALS